MSADVTVSFFGDVCLQGIAQRRFGFDPQVLQWMRGATLRVCNLESPITERSDPIPYQAILIKSAPDPRGLIRCFDVFSLANNHIYDYGGAGLHDTIGFLAAAKKHHFGAGPNRQEAARPLILTVNGRSLAFLSFSRWHRAGRRTAGAAPDDAAVTTRQVRRLHQAGHFVIVFPHWNYEYVGLPSPRNRRLAFRLIDAGADLVVGAHPHVLQPCETYKGKLICHSLGNFIFHHELLSPPDPTDLTPHYSAILNIAIPPKGLYTHEFLPIYSDSGGVRTLVEQETATVGERLARLERQLSDRDEYARAFYREAASVIRSFSSRFGEQIRRQGPMYLLSRLHRLRLEDLRIRLHRPPPSG